MKTTLTGTQVTDLLTRRVEVKKTWSMPDYWVRGIANDECHDLLLRTHSMQAYEDNLFEIAYDPAQHRMCYLIKNAKGEVVNAVGRALKKAWPKTLTYSPAEIPFIAGVGRKHLFVVEDCASASSVCRLPDSSGLALLGTHLRQDFIPYIVAADSVIVALDKDAFKKTLQLRTRLLAYRPEVKFVKLEQDIKDMKKDDLWQMGIDLGLVQSA